MNRVRAQRVDAGAGQGVSECAGMVDLEEDEAMWNNIVGVVEGKKGSGSGFGPGGWTRE